MSTGVNTENPNVNGADQSQGPQTIKQKMGNFFSGIGQQKDKALGAVGDIPVWKRKQENTESAKTKKVKEFKPFFKEVRFGPGNEHRLKQENGLGEGNLRVAAADDIKDIMEGDHGKAVAYRLEGVPVNINGKILSDSERYDIAARQQVEHLYKMLYGEAPKNLEMVRNNATVRSREMHRIGEVWKLVDAWHKDMIVARELQSKNSITFNQDRNTGDRSVDIHAPSVRDAMIGLLSADKSGWDDDAIKLLMSHKNENGNMILPEKGDVLLSQIPGIAGATAREAGRILENGGLNGVAELVYHSASFANEFFGVLNGGEGMEQKVVELREKIRLMRAAAPIVEDFLSKTPYGPIHLEEMLLQQLGVGKDSNLLDAFIDATTGIEQQYLNDHPIARMKSLEDRAQTFSTITNWQRQLRIWGSVSGVISSPIKLAQRIGNTEAYKNRKAERDARIAKEKQWMQDRNDSVLPFNIGTMSAGEMKNAAQHVDAIPGARDFLDNASAVDDAINKILVEQIAKSSPEARAKAEEENRLQKEKDKIVSETMQRFASKAMSLPESNRGAVRDIISERYGSDSSELAVYDKLLQQSSQENQIDVLSAIDTAQEALPQLTVEDARLLYNEAQKVRRTFGNYPVGVPMDVQGSVRNDIARAQQVFKDNGLDENGNPPQALQS